LAERLFLRLRATSSPCMPASVTRRLGSMCHPFVTTSRSCADAPILGASMACGFPQMRDFVVGF
jgi:hypothetical protein